MSKEDLIPLNKRTKAEQKKITHKGGVKSGQVRREKATLRAILREELDKDGGNGMTKLQYLVAKAMQNHAKDRLTFKDLKDLQDLLGESITNLNVSGEQPVIIVRSQEEADKLARIGSIENKDGNGV